MCECNKDDCKCDEKGGCGCVTRCDNPALARHFAEAENVVWSCGEKANLKATALYHVKACVERYGGTVTIDLATNRLDIDFPDEVSPEVEAECALEVAEIMNKAGFDLLDEDS